MYDFAGKEALAENIRYYMALSGKERMEICRDLGMKYSTFTDWVNAKKYPRIDKIERLAEYFGISISELVEKKESKQLHNAHRQKDISEALLRLVYELKETQKPMLFDKTALNEAQREILSLQLTQCLEVTRRVLALSRPKMRKKENDGL